MLYLDSIPPTQQLRLNCPGVGGRVKKLFDPYLTTLTVLQKEWLLFAAFLFKLFLRTYTKVPWDACNFCVRELFGFLAAVCLSLQLP
jgi:hypothetical protein